jgi:mRNA-degrading endonuclease toxin of MazEF toxin-antitoxin module
VNQWEIWTYAFPEGDHPAVVISPSELCANSSTEEVNVLFASSARPVKRPPKLHEVLLDESDGLDWKTVVRCHRIHLVRKGGLKSRRGLVSLRRRTEIARKLVEVFRLPL